MNLKTSVIIKEFGPGIGIIFLHFLASDKGGETRGQRSYLAALQSVPGFRSPECNVCLISFPWNCHFSLPVRPRPSDETLGFRSAFIPTALAAFAPALLPQWAARPGAIRNFSAL